MGPQAEAQGRSLAMACLRVPAFLGVHSIALGEELALDDGALRLVVGAAHHDDQAAQLRAELLHERRAHGGLEASAHDILGLPSASGSRVLGGAFLRVTLHDAAADASACRPYVHLWLDVSEAGSRHAAENPKGEAPKGEAAASSALSEMGLIQRIGPYRLRVLSSRVLPAAADESGLGGGESVLVAVAVDKRQPEAAAIPPQLEQTADAGGRHAFWLSTQGATQLSLTEPACAGGAACDAEAEEPCELDSRFVCSLPPLGALPALGAAGAAAGESSVEVRLHTLRHSGGGAAVDATHDAGFHDAGFGCAACTWAAELDGMSLGAAEGHAVLPLQLMRPDEPAPPVRLGNYELRVLQCIGHYTRAGPRVGLLESDYPLLLLHVRVELRRIDEAVDGGGHTRLAEARRLGDELERLLG